MLYGVVMTGGEVINTKDSFSKRNIYEKQYLCENCDKKKIYIYSICMPDDIRTMFRFL